MKNNKKKIFSCIYIVVNIVLIGMISSISWTTKDYSVNQKKNAHLIGVSYMTMNNIRSSVKKSMQRWNQKEIS